MAKIKDLIKKSSTDEKGKSWLLLSVELGFMLCIFAPLEAFFTNESEFWFNLSHLLPVLLVVFVAFTLSVMAFCCFVQKSKVSFYVYSFMFCTLLFLYIQGNYVPRNYGVFNGVDIEWDSYTSYAVVSIVLLLVFFVLWIVISLKVKEKIYPVARVICIILLLIQLVTIGTLYIQNNVFGEKNTDSIVVTTDDMFHLSKDKNILIFILDAFDSAYMQEELNGENGDKYREIFSDFTYYPDTLGTYPTTRAALPYILTGVWYENDKPYVDYVRDAHTDNEIYTTLEENDYSVSVYTSPLYISPDYSMYTNVREGKYVVGNYGDFAAKIYQLVAFNYMPHQIKRVFYDGIDEWDELKALTDGKKSFSSDVQRFYSLFESDGLSLSEINNCFKVYHLYGVHPKYTFDETLTTDKNKTYDVYDEVAGNFYLMNEFMNELKESGAYDNTTIVIMADHGQVGVYHQNPLFMIKNAGESHEFAISDAEMSYQYLSKIFISLATGNGVDEEYINSCSEEEPQRRFLYYLWERKWDKECLPSMSELFLDGDANNPDNLKMTGRHYLSGGIDYSYKLGAILSFAKETTAKKATAKEYCVYGFSVNEESITWTEGEETLMQFDIADEYENLLVSMEYITYASAQRVCIYANDNKVVEFVARGEEKQEFIIPGEYVKGGSLSLRFELPDAVSPESRGENTDERSLALAMKNITISSTDKAFDEKEQIEMYKYELGSELSFGGESTAEEYCVYGFSVSEEDGTWTDGKKALMQFNIAEEHENLSVNMEYMTYTSAQRVRVYANDNEVAEFVAGGEEEQEFIIPNEYVKDGSLSLSYELPDAVSPKSMGENTDERNLALAMKSITISSTDKAFDEEKQKETYKYELDNELLFTREATAEEYCVYGFSVNEEDGAWTDGNEVLMLFDISDEYENLSVKMEYGTYTSSQWVSIYANDKKVAEFVAMGSEEREIIIPDEYVKNGLLSLRFELPCAISPKDRGESTDTRNLALVMKNLTISSTNKVFDEEEQKGMYKYELGNELSFAKEATAEEYCVYGFSVNEGNGTWTDGNEALMQFNIAEEYENLSVKMRYGTYTPSQDVYVYANNHKVVEFAATGAEEREFVIPGEYVMDGRLSLRFEFLNAASAKDRGEGIDIRKLALAMERITISSAE